jgi:hypothetical protein
MSPHKAQEKERHEREEEEREREREKQEELEREREEELEEVEHKRAQPGASGQPSLRDVVTPQAASPSFYLTVTCTYPAGATQIGQATTYQLITPWGQSTPCLNLLDALNQMVAAGSAYSGQMWNYLFNGVTRGLTTTSATVPVSATYFQQVP